MVARSTALSAVDPGKQISIILALPLGDSKGAAEFVQHVSDPKDPLFRQYITPKEFADRYGANADDYAAIKAWAAENQLTIVHEASARTSVTVRGTAAQFERLFGTRLNNYRSSDGKEFYSASVEPTIPNVIAAKVTGVIGLTNSVQYASLAKVHRVFGETAPANVTDSAGGTGPGGAYTPADLRSVYRMPGFGAASPQTVAVFEQGGFFRTDIETFLDRMHLPNRPVKVVNVDGYNGSVDDLGIELEAVLDIDVVIGINPSVKEVLVYEDGVDPFGVALIDALEQVATDNQARILSISYGVDEVQQGNAQIAAENTALTQLAAQGITVLASAGDGGAYGRTGTNYVPAHLEAPDPGSQPLLTCVGGTTLTTGPNLSWLEETVWNRLGIAVGATGGGVSSYWPIPNWQAPSYVTTNGGSATYRNVPDVGAVGDPYTGVAVYSKMNGGWQQIGGTSLSAPIWAGYLSILNSGLEYVTGQDIGFLNPTLYNPGFGSASQYQYPVPDGTNGDPGMFGTPGYNGGIGYTNCAGTGTIFGGGFGFQMLSSESGGTPPGGYRLHDPVLTDTSASFTWTPAKRATGYVVGLFLPQHNFFECFVRKTTDVKLTGLIPQTRYFFYLMAVNKHGTTETGFLFTTK
jgi:subtilase family serine protease